MSIHPRQLKWFHSCVVESLAQLQAAYDCNGATTVVRASSDHVALSSTVMCVLLRLSAAVDLLAGDLNSGAPRS